MKIERLQHVTGTWKQCLGRFLGIIGQNPSVSKSTKLHVDIFRFVFINLRYTFSKSSRLTGSFYDILNFNWLFLKLNQFICNQRSVSSPRSLLGCWPIMPKHLLGSLHMWPKVVWTNDLGVLVVIVIFNWASPNMVTFIF